MNAYVQMMGGKHRVVIVAPAGQKVTLQPAYSSKASAEQAIKTWGFTLTAVGENEDEVFAALKLRGKARG